MGRWKDLGKRFVILFVGFFLLALASVFMKQANIGLGPWDALHDGISRQTPLTYGQASMAVGLLIVVVDFLCKERLGFGTLLNIFVIGLLIDLVLEAGLIPKMSGAFLPGLLYGFCGMVLMALGIWLYIGAAMGAGPRDSLMVILTRRTGKPVGLCRATVEGVALVLGFLLGGPGGAGHGGIHPAGRACDAGGFPPGAFRCKGGAPRYLQRYPAPVHPGKGSGARTGPVAGRP